MKEAKSPADMVKKIKEKFELEGHKAAAIGMVQHMCNAYLVSDMEMSAVKSMFFTPFETAQSAIDTAISTVGTDGDVIVIPFGGATLPYK